MSDKIKKIFLIGADGQLGSDLKIVLEKDCQIFSPLINELSITDFKKARNILTITKPDLVINTAVYLTDVDGMEENYEETFKVNTLAVNNLAKICEELDSTLIHISSDFVFDGEKKGPYFETDPTNPLNVYGVSKVASESFVRYGCRKYFIVRPTVLFGKKLCRHQGNTNLIEKVISWAKEDKEMIFKSDTYLSPTYTLELAYVIKELVKTNQYGLYHITNDGFCTPYEFAREVLALSGLNANLISIKTADYEKRIKGARRPVNSVLANNKIKTLGLYKMSPWQTAIKKYLKEKKHIVSVKTKKG